MKRLAFLIASFVVATGWASAGYGQSGPMPVTVLSFSEEGSSSGLGEAMYNALRTQVEFHREYRLNDVPPQPLDDLLLAVGCSELTADCGQLVGELMGTRFLAWGEVTDVGAEVHLTMVLWDLEEAREVRTRVHALPVSEIQLFSDHHQVVGRSLLYGDRGTLTVDALPEGARVRVDGRDVGASPATLEDLPFGFYKVDVSYDGYQSFTEYAVVDLGGTTLTPTLGPLVAERERARDTAVVDRPHDRGPISTAPAQWTLVGVGGASLIAGVAFAAQKGSSQREFDRVASLRELDRGRAEALRADGERQARLSNVFIATGSALVVTGIVWRLLDPPDKGSAGEASIDWGAYASSDGAGVSFRLTR